MAPRGLTPEDRRIWDRIARSVEAPRRRQAARVDPDPPATPPAVSAPTASPRIVARARPDPYSPSPPKAAAPARGALSAPEALEPRRHRRLSRERDPIEAVLDLHGHGRFDAQDRVTAFLTQAQARGHRAVLIITGQGRRGGGVIRASAAEWLRAPALRGVVAGFSAAHRRHGGEGALYVTLRRRG